MTEVIVKTRKWGNSMGITLPKELVKKQKIKANQEIRIEIKQRSKKPDPKVFGALKNWRIDSQKLKDTLREESDW